MKYTTPEAFRAAPDQRIRNESMISGVPIMRLRKRVAFERFLARSAMATPQRWVLKGAFALDLRLGLRARTTKDIDLAGADDEQTATADLISAEAIDLHDYFSFDVKRTPTLDRVEAFSAVRYSVTAQLAGRRFEQFPVDVALGERPTALPERLPIPSLLEFAEIPAGEVRVIALEQHVAEKVHAYTATYGQRLHPSTRTKDLIDLLLIADLATLRAERLRDSLDTTFKIRGRQSLPTALPPPPPSWRTPYVRAAEAVGVSSDLDIAHTDAATFLDPVLAHTAAGCWDPELRRWTART